MDALPIFSHMDDMEQASQLIDFLNSIGGQITERDLSEADAVRQVAVRDQVIHDLVNACHVLGSLESESEIEMVLNSIMSLVVIVSDAKAKQIVDSFCAKLVSSPEFERLNIGGALIRVLSNLFHGFMCNEENLPRRRLQYGIYCSILKVATKTNQVSVVPTELSTLRRWFDCWQVSVEEKRNCLRLVHTALLQGHHTGASTKTMLELLGTYTESDAGSAQNDAAEAIRTAIADSGTYLFDHLLDLSPVAQLKNHKIYDLLLIFVSGCLQDYMIFYEKNKNFVDDLPLDHKQCIFKMQVLTLMSMSVERQEIPFLELASKLDIQPGERLEEFIIEAVQTRMIKAKMDQMGDKLLIGSVDNRTFERPQWEQLKTRLGIWTSNLRQLGGYLESLGVK